LTPAVLPYLAVARVSGPDAQSFLQAQLTADIDAVEAGGATFACYCSPRGQVFGLLLVCRLGDEYRLVADSRLLPAILQRLKLFVLRARVALEPEPRLAVQACEPDDGASPGDMEFRPAAPGLAYRLFVDTPGHAEDWEPWKREELARNVVWLAPQTSERFIPQMLGFDRIGAVSFSKGCYPGQEIIARARYLGTVKRKPLLLRVENGPSLPPGDPLQIRDGDRWLDGTAVDSVPSGLAGSARCDLLFVVAPVPDGAVDAVGYAGGTYRCATM
jgi:folate-binding protein YgfZ